MSSATEALARLAQEIITDNVCPELAAQATQLVMGAGNPQAKIVFIGEAPGKQEDLTGQPFVGASGKFLDEMLAQGNFGRDDIYITNIVKYRPPNNRDPKLAEKAAMWPYLLRQLEIISPRIVVTLGRHSMGYFLPDKKIGEVHGQLFEVQLPGSAGQGRSWSVAPLYHPAAALYNGSMRQVLLDDFKQLVQHNKTA